MTVLHRIYRRVTLRPSDLSCFSSLGNGATLCIDLVVLPHSQDTSLRRVSPTQAILSVLSPECFYGPPYAEYTTVAAGSTEDGVPRVCSRRVYPGVHREHILPRGVQ